MEREAPDWHLLDTEVGSPQQITLSLPLRLPLTLGCSLQTPCFPREGANQVTCPMKDRQPGPTRWELLEGG